ncbi:hypothetical protein APY94_08125 [Thermococcus celericrescens]|uniref:Uncharacterized protein n=1 Tax=Thermococcus celericrescens TaxID=227598 RepID=A0A100XX44_9EURY|nr:hypothetical protein APY94_08125 [Thermococcus celericrescens]
MLGIASSGCINGNLSSQTSSTSPVTPTEKWTVVLTLVGPSGEKNLTLDELRKLPQAEGTGGYKTKLGSIKDIRYLQGGPPESVLEKNPLVVYEGGRFKIPEMGIDNLKRIKVEK